MGPVKPRLKICVTGNAQSPHISLRAKAIANLGHKVELISPNGADLEGIEVTVPKGKSISFGPLRKIWMLISTLLIVLFKRVDLFHSHYAGEYATWAIALLNKKPFVISVMGGDVLFDEQGNLDLVGRWLTCFALKRADLVTVKSPHLIKVVEALGVEKSKIKQVIWGIYGSQFQADPVQVQGLRQSWGLEENTCVLLSPRALQPLYNQNLMLDALAEIVKIQPNVKLVMSTYAAHETYKQSLIDQAEQLGLTDQLIFQDPLPYDEMANLYGAGDMILSLPSSDGFPQTFVEAAFLKKPCIMAKLDHFEGLIDHEKEVLFVSFEAQHMARTILKSIDEPEITAKIVENAFNFVKVQADLAAQAHFVEQEFLRLTSKNQEKTP